MSDRLVNEITKGKYNFEARTGIAPYYLYLGINQAITLSEYCLDMLRLYGSSRTLREAFPSEFMGMKTTLVSQENHLSFGLNPL